MRLERKVMFWLGAIAVALLGMYVLGNALLPFAAGLILAYLLDPVADRLQRAGLNRLGAALVIIAAFLIAVVLVLLVVVPILLRQFQAFVESLPSLVNTLQSLAATEGGRLIDRYGGGILERFGLNPGGQSLNLQQSFGDIVGQGTQWILGFLRSLWSGGRALVNLFSLLVVTPVVTFYILVDWDRMVAAIDSWVPIRQRGTVRELAREIDRALSGFLHGQSLVCVFLAIWYALGLTVIGLNFGLLIGVSAGLLSFIPYVGSLGALVVSSGIAIVQGWPEWNLLFLTLAVVVTGQMLEGYILSPWLVGSSVGLHPVWIMLALFAFGALFGFAGLILGVPLAAAIGVIMRFALRRYLASPLYLGVTSAEPLPAGPPLAGSAPARRLASPPARVEQGAP